MSALPSSKRSSLSSVLPTGYLMLLCHSASRLYRRAVSSKAYVIQRASILRKNKVCTLEKFSEYWPIIYGTDPGPAQVCASGIYTHPHLRHTHTNSACMTTQLFSLHFITYTTCMHVSAVPLCNHLLATTFTLEVQCLIVDGPPDHLPKLLHQSRHHVTCRQLGLSQHTIPALYLQYTPCRVGRTHIHVLVRERLLCPNYSSESPPPPPPYGYLAAYLTCMCTMQGKIWYLSR